MKPGTILTLKGPEDLPFLLDYVVVSRCRHGGVRIQPNSTYLKRKDMPLLTIAPQDEPGQKARLTLASYQCLDVTIIYVG